jgi:hypothetical protein
MDARCKAREMARKSSMIEARRRTERPMTGREKTTLVLELSLATALASWCEESCTGARGCHYVFAVPSGELTWAALILCFRG